MCMITFNTDLLEIEWDFLKVLSLAWKNRFSLKTLMWGLPLWFEPREPKLMSFERNLLSGSQNWWVAFYHCVKVLYTVLLLYLQFSWYTTSDCCTASSFFPPSPSFLVTVLHQKHMLWQWSPSSHYCTACLSWCGSGSSVAIYWLRSCSAPVLLLLLKGTGCSCLSHSQTFPFLHLPWLLHSLMVNQVPSSDQIHRGRK